MTLVTNEEYFDALALKIEELNSLREIYKDLVVKIVGDTLTSDDLFFFPSADRAMHLMDGFIEMLKMRNLTCTGALLRLQLDNCMRTYAAFIAKDRTAVIDCVVSGNRIDKQVSRDDKKMTDGYLKNEMSKIDSRFSNVYDYASSYIHFSDSAFYQTVENCENFNVKWSIGMPLSENYNSVLLEMADAFIYYVKLHDKMLKAVADSKSRYDEEHKNDE